MSHLSLSDIAETRRGLEDLARQQGLDVALEALVRQEAAWEKEMNQGQFRAAVSICLRDLEEAEKEEVPDEA